MSVRLGTELLAGASSNDNISITKNSSNKLQSIGIIDQNDTSKSIKTWVGTRAEYDELVANDEIDYNTVYNITDENNNFTQVVLETLYPVGAIYIGIMDTCPLAALFGTWEKVSSGRVLQGADNDHQPGTTIEAGLPNITGGFYGVRSGGTSGAFTSSGTSKDIDAGTTYYSNSININASRSSSIYGNSDTVQPPAFVVNIWKRTE